MVKQPRFKSLRIRTILILVVQLMVLVIAFYFLLNTIMLSRITLLEDRFIVEHIERFENAIESDLIVLSSVAEDWAVWSDTYEFIVDMNNSYINQNLTYEAIVNLRFNLMAFIDQSGELVFARGIDEEGFLPVNPDLSEHLKKSIILNNKNMDYKVSGIIVLDEGPMLIASHPILTSLYEGPVRGHVVVGRFLNEEEVSNYSNRLNLNITVARLDQPANDELQDFSTITGENPVSIQRVSGEDIMAHL